MSKIREEGDISDEDLMIHILNTKENDVILDGLENDLSLSGPDALTIEVIYRKFNPWYEKIKNKNKEKNSKSIVRRKKYKKKLFDGKYLNSSRKEHKISEC